MSSPGDTLHAHQVNILNALARHGEEHGGGHDQATIAFLSEVAQGLPQEAFLSRHLAIAVNAM